MHSFIPQAAVDRLKLKPKTHQRLQVTVADGKSFECDSVVSIALVFGISVGNGSFQLPVTCYVSQDLLSKVIIGIDWL